MTDEKFAIPQVTVLHGHISPDTAYLVTDYPYGRTLRCQIRYWLHTADKGQHKHQTRFTSQTTNPKRDGTVWNQPKSSTYATWMVMYLDHTQQNRAGENYVRHLATGLWVDAAFADRVRLCGAYTQLGDDSRKLLDALTEQSKRINHATWDHYDQRKQAVQAHYATTGELPPRDATGRVLDMYMSEDDFQVICAWVLDQANPAS